MNPQKENVIPFKRLDRLDDGRSFFYTMGNEVKRMLHIVYMLRRDRLKIRREQQFSRRDRSKIRRDRLKEQIYNGIRERLADNGVIRKEE